MTLTRKSLAISVIVFVGTLGFAPTASATIHPLVESFDCANANAFASHPLGDPADPPGVTPTSLLAERDGPAQNHSEQSTLRSVNAVADGDFSSPALFGHKLDGTCGHAGT